MLKFERTHALIASVSLRGDKHGNERVPGLAIGFTLIAPNTILDSIEPGFKEMFYTSTPRANDLNDPDSQTEVELEDTPLPYKKTDLIDKVPVVFKQEAYHAVFYGKGKRKDLSVDGVTLQEIVVEPINGGSVKLYGKIILKNVDEKISGYLGVLVQQHTDMDLHPPTEEELKELKIED